MGRRCQVMTGLLWQLRYFNYILKGMRTLWASCRAGMWLNLHFQMSRIPHGHRQDPDKSWSRKTIRWLRHSRLEIFVKDCAEAARVGKRWWRVWASSRPRARSIKALRADLLERVGRQEEFTCVGSVGGNTHLEHIPKCPNEVLLWYGEQLYYPHQKRCGLEHVFFKKEWSYFTNLSVIVRSCPLHPWGKSLM